MSARTDRPFRRTVQSGSIGAPGRCVKDESSSFTMLCMKYLGTVPFAPEIHQCTNTQNRPKAYNRLLTDSVRRTRANVLNQPCHLPRVQTGASRCACIPQHVAFPVRRPCGWAFSNLAKYTRFCARPFAMCIVAMFASRFSRSSDVGCP